MCKDNLKTKLSIQEHYHFIGLGGIGMSGIALGLLKKGFSVSGSDPNNNDRIIELTKNGAIVFNSQSKKNIDFIIKKYSEKKIIIVKSSAIKLENIELDYCLKKKFEIKHRSDILSQIMQTYDSIAIAGSHGKTTTSTFLTTLMNLCTNDVSSIVGGILPFNKSNTLIKDSKYIVVEVDESDGTTNKYYPYLGIINNIDYDHCDYYSNIEGLLLSFNQFALNSQKTLTNFDCKITQKNIKSNFRWSIKEIDNIEFALIPKQLNRNYTLADYYEKEKFIATLNIPIPGKHNLENITATIAACRILNIDIKKITNNIQQIQLPKKRFEVRGEIYGRTIVDDYGHHPNEIKATIQLARLFIQDQKFSKRRLVIIFQPHRYSRVNKFLSEFVKELSKGDLIIITDIYSAGEKNLTNINSQIIADKIYNLNKNVYFLNNNNVIIKKFLKLTNKGDLILNMGAGDCHNLWSLLKSYY